MVRDKILENCPVKLEHITNAKNVFGPNISGLWGNSVRTNPTREEREYISIQRDFYDLHIFVTLTAHMMFVNGLPYLITLSRKIYFFTAKYIPTRTAEQLSSSLNKTVKLYARNEFVVNVVMMDMEFEKVSEKIGNT